MIPKVPLSRQSLTLALPSRLEGNFLLLRVPPDIPQLGQIVQADCGLPADAIRRNGRIFVIRFDIRVQHVAQPRPDLWTGTRPNSMGFTGLALRFKIVTRRSAGVQATSKP
jgi:hypothetical protein